MMRIVKRWRKSDAPRNAIIIDAALIRGVMIDNLDFSIPETLQDYVFEVDDWVLNAMGEEIASDPEIWETLTHVIVDFVMTYKFSEILNDGGLLDD